MRIPLAVGLIALAIANAAHADTVSYTKAFSGTFASTDGDRMMVETPGFDASLGTLTSVSYRFAGDGEDVIVGENGPATPFLADFVKTAYIYGLGFDQAVSLNGSAGPATFASVTVPISFDFTAVDNAGLAYYAADPSILTEFAIDTAVHQASDGKFVGYSDDRETLSGALTETFTYTPIPEPGSATILCAAVLGLLGPAKLSITRARQRSGHRRNR